MALETENPEVADANAAAQALLQSLESRHDAVLQELDLLDARIEQVLNAFSQQRDTEPKSNSTREPSTSSLDNNSEVAEETTA